jgi:hypothetical protein
MKWGNKPDVLKMKQQTIVIVIWDKNVAMEMVSRIITNEPR